MDEFVSLITVSRAGEDCADFGARLTLFWTHMLRNFQDEFELVYAEATQFGQRGDRWTRQYLAGDAVLDLLEREMSAHSIDYDAIDRDETFSRYEAVGPDWMQIEH